MAAKLGCCLEETVISHFHQQMTRSKHEGQALDTLEDTDKASDESAVQCLRRRLGAVSALVDEFRVRCMQSPPHELNLLSVDGLHTWLGAQQHLKLPSVSYLTAYYVPTEGILRVTEVWADPCETYHLHFADINRV